MLKKSEFVLVALAGALVVRLVAMAIFPLTDTTEARYGWASDELGFDFVGFDKLDLAGFQVTAGFTVRF